MKLKEKLKAVALRKSGKSYNDILKQVSVSKSTLSLWLREIELTSQQRDRLLTGIKKSQYASAQAKKQRRLNLIEQIVRESKKEAYLFIENSLFLSGLMLYWAEGDKSEKREGVKFSNSDPEMIKLIMRWFRENCKVPEEKFRIGLHIHTLHCRRDIEEYWSKITGIPLSQFYKTQVKKTSLGQRKNKLYNGTCSVAIGNKNLFRKIKGWKLGFLDKINVM
jgi:hypothetical protein